VITTTNTMLLLGLRDQGDDRIWSEFCSRYRPLLVSFARRLGLAAQDAQDAAQEALLAFATAYREGKYDREKGRLRTWLSAIATRKVRDIQRHRLRDLATGAGGETKDLIREIPDDRAVADLWDAEWRRAVVSACLQEIRGQVEPTTLQAFELFVLKEWPAESVATHLGISRNAVFLAKRRVLTRMREIQRQLEDFW
jgi:RNA polymerase sigma-70 factor (ECF subfamily)